MLIAITFGSVGCSGDPKPVEQKEEHPPKKMTTIPRFNKDTAYAFVKEQVDFGPRVLGSEAHEKAKN
ncbi:MAG TPA: peptidase, partial [Saprospiraceae bacterium]|nr:peptidase [Saprospiraceae bacterium]